MVFIEQFGKPQIYKINLKNCEKAILQLISSTPYNGWDLGVQFANTDYIKDLNFRYRGKDKATDILSFGFHQTLEPGKLPNVVTEDEKNIGDLVISLDYVRDQYIQLNPKSNETQIKKLVEDRLPILFTHGIVHCLGFDHELDDDYLKMNLYEEEILKAYRIWLERETDKLPLLEK